LTCEKQCQAFHFFILLLNAGNGKMECLALAPLGYWAAKKLIKKIFAKDEPPSNHIKPSY